MPKRTQQPTASPSPAPWPDGVTARYLTALDATVDLMNLGAGRAAAHCTASCDWTTGATSSTAARASAQDHAATCRALPRPDDAR